MEGVGLRTILVESALEVGLNHEGDRTFHVTLPPMDRKSLEKLEFPKVLDLLAGYAAFSASKEEAWRLEPALESGEVRRRQCETTEARRLLIAKPGLSVGGAHDVRPQAGAAAHGAALEPQDLLDIKSTLISARTLERFFEKADSAYPTLGDLARGLQPMPGLIDLISRVVSDRGEVLDTASETLAAIRRDLRKAHDRLMTKLQRMLSDPKLSPMLQEPIVTQRDGRFVLPLRAEFKGRIRSVIHDQSASGATLFIEPVTIVDLNNEVRELELTERDEVRRILAEVSARIGAESLAISQTVEALAAIDLAIAKARYAESMKAWEPILLDWQEAGEGGGRIRLMAARHPLLDPETVVPVDVILDAETTALVITGPNTGGKTVALKTAGLLSLMAQAGLHLPAASGSEIALFEGVYADIGDEQSIEQSLSTFSAHIANIIHILERAGPRSLVILDELGAGTDPQEGSALARAILDELIERNATTLVATHYPELKTFAHTTDGVRNASVEFDLRTLRPTYHLVIGLPGRSNALAIAERLGLQPAVIARARQMLNPEDVRAEGLLDEIHRQRDAARLSRREAEAAQSAVEALKAELQTRLEAIEEERSRVMQQANAEAQSELEALHEEIEQLRRDLKGARQPLEVLQQLEGSYQELVDEALVPVTAAPLQSQMDRPLRPRPGDRVRLRSLQSEGIVQEVQAEQVEVLVGRLRVRARLDELELPQQAVPAAAPRRVSAQASSLPPAPPLEIDLRGLAADEALEELERRLDAAYLAGLPFLRIIHGKGTGKLRQAVRQALQGNPYVTSALPGNDAEGGEGVTVVKLASA